MLQADKILVEKIFYYMCAREVHILCDFLADDSFAKHYISHIAFTLCRELKKKKNFTITIMLQCIFL